MNNSQLTLLRWFLVLPGAIGIFVGIQLFVAILTSFLPIPEPPVNVFCQVINTIAAPYFFVFVGAKIAPRNTLAVGLILAILYGIGVGAVITLNAITPNRYEPLWWTIIKLILGIIAAVVCCVQLRNEEKQYGASAP